MSPKPQFTSYNCQPQGGFVLHDNKLVDDYIGGGGDMRYQNGDQSHHRSLGVNHVNYSISQPQHTSFQLHADHSPRPLATPPSASPQHRSSVQRISQLMGEPGQGDGRTEKSRSPPTVHAPIPTPPVDDMEPQSISFIGKTS
ncbi:hypothetical protein PR048_016303 [Dryococelus australis]|uniref:Uncharacterized protein n=1 Tax=Dryococelus australis TaxID=614101 RepID=A0ABQ9HJC3_9NEOP|nr:hypothetical protein PR048_016303 [Dryococelus australis]